MQAEKRKNEHDDDDQADKINDSIHDCLRTSRPNIGVNQFLTFARFRSSRGTTSRSRKPPETGLRDRLRGTAEKLIIELLQLKLLQLDTQPRRSQSD